MRARRGLILGWVVVGLYAAAIVVALITTTDGERTGDDGAVASFVEAWERSREATFIRTGTFERRSDVTNAAITSEDVLAQRPPQRIHRQLGGVDGRNDRRVIVCAAQPGDDSKPAACKLGDAAGATYDEDVAAEVAALRTLVEGPTPVYSVERAGNGCFALDQLRSEPRAPFGVEARFCFDDATGAPTNSRVRYAGGIVEVVAVTDLAGTVDDADLEP